MNSSPGSEPGGGDSAGLVSAVPRKQPAAGLSWRDLIAGVSVAFVLIPQSMAYAELAGLPGHVGLYAATLPLVAAALFASSPYLQTGPVAMTALLSFGVLTQRAEAGTAEYAALAALLAVMIGLVRIALGLTGSGWVSYLMSRPVLRGFTSAAALLIILTQIPGVFGVSPAATGVVGGAWWVVSHAEAWHMPSVALSLGTLVLIVAGRRMHALLPGALVATAGGLLFSAWAGCDGPVIGEIPATLPHFSADLPWAAFPSLALPSIVIAIVGFAEVAAISRGYASRERMPWSPDREFVSQGAANLTAGLFGAFPVGGSFARSAVNHMAGARSRWSGAVTGLSVLAFLPFAGILAPLPKAVLSGIVIAAAGGLIRPRAFIKLWRLSPRQALVRWFTFAVSLALAPRVDLGVLAGVLASLATHVWRERRADFDSRVEAGILHIDVRGVLWFASAPEIQERIFDKLAKAGNISAVVISLRGLGRIDLTAALTLKEILDEAKQAGLRASLIEIPAHAQPTLGHVLEQYADRTNSFD